MRFGRAAHFNWLLADESLDFPLVPSISWQSEEQFSANLEVRITSTLWYLPSVWPFRRMKPFRFVTERRSDGKIYFRATPLYP